MKRIGATVLTGALILLLAACGGGSGSSSSTGGSGTSNATSAQYSTITGPSGSQPADSSTAVTLIIQAYDSSNKKMTSGGAAITASATNGALVTGTQDNNNGTYTVTLESAVIGNALVSFTVAGTTSPNTASVQFVAPSATANYYVPYTTVNGSSSTSSTGLYLVNAANPSATPVTVTASSIDTATTEGGLATFYRMVYDPSTHEQVQMLPAFVVYGQNGHFYGVDLSTSGGKPVQLTSASYGYLCSISPIATGSYGVSTSWIAVKVVTTSGAVASDCNSSSAVTYWAFKASASATTAPTVVPAFNWAGSLHDPSTGEVTDIVVFTGSELDLYSPDTFTKTKTLQSGFASGSTAYSLGYTIGYAGDVVDVENIKATEQDDFVYTVTPTSATKEYQYTMPTSGLPALSSGVGGCNATTQTSYTLKSIAAGDTVYYEAPDGTSGYDVVAVPLNGGAAYTVYYDGTNCFDGFEGQASGYLVLEIHSPNQNAGQKGPLTSESISITGGNAQTPVVLATDSTYSTSYKSSWLHYVAGGYAWVDSWAYDTSFNTTGHNVDVVSLSNGSVVKEYANTGIVGDVWQGIDADGDLIRSKILLGAGAINTSCNDLALTSITQQNSSLGSGSNTATMPGTECWNATTYGPAALVVGSYYAASDNTSFTFYGLSLGANGNGATLETYGTPAANTWYTIALTSYAY